jgi:hypothetical protein
MENDKVNETLRYLKTHPGFLKTYFKYIQMAQAGDVKAKQLVNTMVSANPDMFIVIDELLKMANEGDAYAKQIILDNLNADSNA